MANSSSSSRTRALISHSVITGGTFTQHTQHTHDNRQTYIQGAKSGFDRLHDAVAPAAFHNSGERFDPPKCHPNTRVAVMKKIMDWILGQDLETRNALIMWLSGAAGAGKSAIAQSIAELCYAQDCLLASFFFNRSDPNRNHARSLFPTIAYQMLLAIPQVREKLVAAVEIDPHIFTRDLSVQFLSLIVKPLQELLDSGFFDNPTSPRLIIIDGLDECLDRQVQRSILDVILRGIQQHHLPLLILVASRPEHDISTKFDSPGMTSVLSRLVLDDSYLPDVDIELFLREKFQEITQTHPFKKNIPLPWPTDDFIYSLVEKSSGQFIYAATVVRYTESSRHHPHHRLEIVLSLRPAHRDLPFADLDALYTNILSSVDEIEQVLDILSFLILQSIPSTTPESFEKLFSLGPGDIQRLFCDLGSIVTVREKFVVQILHASLSDFLLDCSRSHQVPINIVLKRTEHLRRCFRLLNNNLFADQSVTLACGSAMGFIRNNLGTCIPTPELWDDIFHFSMFHIYMQAGKRRNMAEFEKFFMEEFNYLFLPTFFKFLKSSRFRGAKALHSYHLCCFDVILRSYMQAYYANKHLMVLVTLIDFFMHHQQHGHYIFMEEFRLFDVDPVLSEFDGRCLALLCNRVSYKEYHQLIHNFLEDPARSRQYALDGEKYGSAALCCLTYLCDHRSAPQTLLQPTRMNKRKKYTPWIWLRRAGVLMKSREWERKANERMYRRSRKAVYFFPESEDMKDPAFVQQLWSEKYSLGLEYLLYFLRRAGRSEELIGFCRRRTFAPRSREFGHQRKKVRRVMTEYLERMGANELGV